MDPIGYDVASSICDKSVTPPHGMPNDAAIPSKTSGDPDGMVDLVLSSLVAARIGSSLRDKTFVEKKVMSRIRHGR